MTDAMSGALRDAYEAIQANNLPLARTILTGYLKTDGNNADAWWLLNYAAADGHEAREALQNVLRIDPSYPGARELLDEVNLKLQAMPPKPQTPVFAPIEPVVAPASKPALTGNTKPLPDDDFDDLDDDDDEDEPSSRRRWLIATLGFLLLLALVWFVFAWLPNRTPTTITPTTVAESGTPQALETAVVQTPDAQQALTEAATAPSDSATATTDAGAVTPEVSPSQPATVEAVVTVSNDTGAPFEALYAALSTFGVQDGSIVVEQTSLGAGLVASVCSSGSAAELRAAIPAVLTTMAQNAGGDGEAVQVIGAKFTDCATGRVVRYVGVPSAQAQAFVNGSIDETAFRSSIQVITP